MRKIMDVLAVMAVMAAGCANPSISDQIAAELAQIRTIYYQINSKNRVNLKIPTGQLITPAYIEGQVRDGYNLNFSMKKTLVYVRAQRIILEQLLLLQKTYDVPGVGVGDLLDGKEQRA